MPKYLCCILLIFVLSNCQQEKDCSFTTVKDLQEADFSKCRTDTFFYTVKKFSGGYNSFRKEKGIPLLPDDFEVLPVTDWENEVIWLNRKKLNDRSFKQAYVKQKNIQWKGDTLIRDYTSIYANDSLKNYISITYLLDSSDAKKGYAFAYGLHNKNISDSAITKTQADSLLNKWGFTY